MFSITSDALAGVNRIKGLKYKTGTAKNGRPRNKSGKCRKNLFKKGLSAERSLGLGHQSLKGFGFAHSDISQDFTVQLDTSFFQAIHELRIGQAVFTSTGINTLDPQAAELALFSATIAVCILQTFFDSLDGSTISIFTATAVTLGSLDNLAVTGV
jgi:hypothetical protein